MTKSNPMNMEKMLDIVKRLNFFSQFTEFERKAILFNNTETCVFKENERIILKGEFDAALFILLAGKAKVTLDDTDKSVATLEPGDIFGEMSFLTDAARTTNIIALDDVVALKIDNAVLGKLSVEIRERIKDKVIERLIERITKMNKQVLSYTF